MSDRHRGERRQEVWVESLQQGFAELRKFAFQLMVQPPREESETLNKPFQVGVGGAVDIRDQAARLSRVAAGKVTR